MMAFLVLKAEDTFITNNNNNTLNCKPKNVYNNCMLKKFSKLLTLLIKTKAIVSYHNTLYRMYIKNKTI